MNRYLSILPDTTPRQWWQFLRRKLGHYQPLFAFDDQHPLVFVLSSGRTGTQTLAALLALSPHLFSFHEPSPKLYGLGRLAYWHGDTVIVQTILREAVRSARIEAWDYAREAGRGYAETSPQLTFLAPVLQQLQPQARFIHLVRHPYAVVRSGMRRQWYVDHPADRTRLHPRPDDPLSQTWPQLPTMAKIAWLWAETNRWILDFTASLPAEQTLFVQAESLFTADQAILSQLYAFAGASLPPLKKIQRILNRRLNAQRTGDFPSPAAWDQSQRQEVWHWVGEVAERLGYTP